MMNNSPIGFFDSGVGGLPYLSWAKERLPRETFVYLADRANFPYGTRSADQVLAAVLTAVEALIDRERPKAMVIACNTASVIALQELRHRFPIPFVGVVPAIKPASERSAHRRIGVLATHRTVEDAYVAQLIAAFASDCVVIRRAGGDVVDLVERRFFDSTPEERNGAVQAALEDFRRERVDSVVLGCTHFIYLQEQMREYLGPGIELIDSREGVGRQLIRILEERGIEAGLGNDAEPGIGPEKKREDRMYLTGDKPPEERYRQFAMRFGLELRESIVA